jgi:DNA-binding Lrp family transcriptional regulator
MTQAVRDTSLEIYHKLKDYFGEQAIEIFKYVNKHPNITRNELHKELDIKEASICGRVKELIQEGVLREGVQRKDFHSRNSAYTLYAINNIDWNLLDLNKNVKKETRTLKIEYDLVNTMYKLINSFTSKHEETIRIGLEIGDPEIIKILKLKSVTSKIVKKYYN